jgi:hypothetical protein
VLPPLVVRQARVEDHDEMLPVMERASLRCASEQGRAGTNLPAVNVLSIKPVQQI